MVMSMGLSTLFIPYSTHLWHLYFWTLIYSIGANCWNACNNVILIEMWKHRNLLVLQLAQVMCSIGTILGPLLVEPYVIGNQICPGVRPQQCEPTLNTTTQY